MMDSPPLIPNANCLSLNQQDRSLGNLGSATILVASET